MVIRSEQNSKEKTAGCAPPSRHTYTLMTKDLREAKLRLVMFE